MIDVKSRFPHIHERISGLGELAYNLWWSWHPDARMPFKMLNRSEWKVSIHNPVMMLHYLGREVFDAALKEHDKYAGR